ncbi:hypothetical protein FA13DRAFT_476059 [Coprinellus micaceus]|uniref:Uncharacterized protein n=1 Tax=Coprinellus micaceus TaxID=71717 RepID=A0A4Y7TAN5_COPMI|nr:hypothetical protein FA13DRAFT_476059 [Coprinellus micaceus]
MTGSKFGVEDGGAMCARKASLSCVWMREARAESGGWWGREVARGEVSKSVCMREVDGLLTFRLSRRPHIRGLGVVSSCGSRHRVVPAPDPPTCVRFRGDCGMEEGRATSAFPQPFHLYPILLCPRCPPNHQSLSSGTGDGRGRGSRMGSAGSSCRWCGRRWFLSIMRKRRERCKEEGEESSEQRWWVRNATV